MTDQTARESYNIWSDEVDKEIESLKRALKNHRICFNKDDKNRCFVGDVIQVRNDLKNILSFMSKYVED